MKAAVVAIGDELLDGRVVDTNSAMIAARLERIGIDLAKVCVAGDPVGDIVRALRFALEDVDCVITTGGIGPTEDDRTRDAVADLAGVALVEDAASWRTIRDYIASRGYVVRESNRRQASFPEGADILSNPMGTAPGFCLTLDGGKRVFAIPGVPSEAERMLADQVLPRLAGGAAFFGTTLCFAGVTESRLGQILAGELREGGAVRVGITSNWGLLRVHLRARSEADLGATRARVHALGARWYVGDGDRALDDFLADRLLERGITVAVSESLTAGLAVARLGSVPGISQVLLEGVVTYSDASKTARLGVPEAVFREHGAVSEQCAVAMAEGLARTSGARLTGSTTGIAGPGGGSDAKPVGLVWLAASFDGVTKTRERRYGNPGREAVRQRAAADLLLLMFELVGAGA